MLKPVKMKLARAQTKITPPKVITTAVVDKTETKVIKKTLEEFKSLKKATLPHTVTAW
jgi:hypothetical protein